VKKRSCSWNNINNNIVICKAHKVSSKAESEAPAVARWAALVGYAKRIVLRRRLKVSAVGESLVSRGKSFQTVGAGHVTSEQPRNEVLLCSVIDHVTLTFNL